MFDSMLISDVNSTLIKFGCRNFHSKYGINVEFWLSDIANDKSTSIVCQLGSHTHCSLRLCASWVVIPTAHYDCVPAG